MRPWRPKLLKNAATGRKGAPRGKVEAKYRNPENPEQTWAGRGLKPRWLSNALKGGSSLEEFGIAKQEKKHSGNRGSKPGK
jgi:DNA-binding protein H-NS